MICVGKIEIQERRQREGKADLDYKVSGIYVREKSLQFLDNIYLRSYIRSPKAAHLTQQACPQIINVCFIEFYKTMVCTSSTRASCKKRKKKMPV